MADYPSLQPYVDQIYTCNRTRCGFCSVECPVFRVKHTESYASRGRMLVSRGLIEGILEPSAELQEVMDACLMCGYCQARCALDNMDIFSAVRKELRAAGFVSPKHEKTAERILEQGTLFDRPTPYRRPGTTPLYLGCAYQSKPQEVATIVSVLEKVGLDPLVSDEVCCSYIVGAVGFEDEFEQAQNRFRQVYGSHLDQEILTVCPTCTATLHDEYGLQVKHALVAVAERLEEMDLKPLGLQVTYHDPCHLGRMLGVVEEPRRILRALGIDVVEMEHHGTFSTCCGGGGGLLDVDRNLAVEVSKNRVRDAVEVGARVIVTACPTCRPTLLRGAGRLANEIGYFVDVLDLWELLDQALSKIGD
ncbi:MAG TPA: (Fe-S)-binding protein [Anaerolineae bacterium]|nr:(Fe-S)-binding protein [Anaerolineae bacterium]